MSFMEVAQLLGYIGEFVGGILIVATLIYLSSQIRQNTSALRAGFEHQWSDQTSKLCHPVALDRQAAEWWVSGAQKFAEMDTVDQQRLVLWEYSVVEGWWYMYLGRQRGLVSDETWEHNLVSMRTFGPRQSLRAAWQAFKHLYNEEFQQILDEALGT